jgi:1,4-alpha-glucan branching enzyme
MYALWVQTEPLILKFSQHKKDTLIVILNFTPVTYYDFEVKVPKEGEYVEVLNSDSLEFGGSGQTIEGSLFTSNDGDSFKIKTKVPPLAVTVLRPKL